MIRSNKWDKTDNVYTQSGKIQSDASTIKVDNHILEYASYNSKRDTFLFNNRIFFGIVNPTQTQKEQYSVNWNYIKSL